jgi:hypothetical protein
LHKTVPVSGSEPSSGSTGTTRSLFSGELLVAPPRDDKSYLNIMEEVEGFEPPRGVTRLSVFKTDPFSQTWVYLHISRNGGPCRTRTYDRTVMSRLL